MKQLPQEQIQDFFNTPKSDVDNINILDLANNTDNLSENENTPVFENLQIKSTSTSIENSDKLTISGNIKKTLPIEEIVILKKNKRNSNIKKTIP